MHVRPNQGSLGRRETLVNPQPGRGEESHEMSLDRGRYVEAQDRVFEQVRRSALAQYYALAAVDEADRVQYCFPGSGC